MWTRRERSADDFTDEVRSHIALETDRLIAEGKSPEDAQRIARAHFGSVTGARERFYESGRLLLVHDLVRDVRYAARSLRRAPMFTTVAVMTLALGIGANTAIFSVVHSVLLRPLPFNDSAALVRVWEDVPASEIFNGKPQRYPAMDVRDVLAVSARARTLTHLVTDELVRPTTTIDGYVTRMDGFSVSAGMFSMLGVPPLIGRTFTADEEIAGRDHVIVLGYEAWQRFGGSSRVLGRTVTFQGDPTNPMLRGIALDTEYTVIGVMPRGFWFPYDNAQFWVPRVLTLPANGRVLRMETIARLADGATPKLAAAEIEAIRRGARGTEAAPVIGAPPRFEVIRLHDELTGSVRPALLVLTAAVGVVLLIACVNVASLLLARTASRQCELAVRVAIGAGRGRLVRQLLTESLFLSGLGGVVGTALAFAGVRLFRLLGTTLSRSDLGAAAAFPRLTEVAVDATVLGYALAVSIVTGVVFGLAPTLRYSRSQQSDVLRAATTSPRVGLKNGLVVAEIALAVLLLTGGGLLINSFMKLAKVDPGFDPSHLLTFQVSTSRSRGPEDQKAFSEMLAERLQAIPGVQSAAYARQLPMVQLQDSITLTTRRHGTDDVIDQAADIRFVSRDYLKTMGIRVIAGRGFTEGDGPGRPGAVLINEAMARRDFQNENPLGTFVILGRPPRATTLQIVGVVANVRQFGLDRSPQPQYFLDYRQLTSDGFVPPPLFPVGAYYTVRTAGNVSGIVGSARAVVRQIDPAATVDNVATMEEILSNSMTRPRMYAVLLGIFAGVAVALAVIGLYGVVAYGVAQRTREIGIRAALGARRASLLGLFLRQGLVLTAIGILIGLAGAAAMSRYLEGMLYGVTPLDPETFVAVSTLFFIVAAIAVCVPARRATMVNPLVALRYE